MQTATGKSWSATLTANKIDLKTKIVHRGQAHSVMIKGPIQPAEKSLTNKTAQCETVGSKR